MKRFDLARKWIAALALACSFSTLELPAAEAAPPCLDNDNPCEPDKLCTFKAQLAEKVFLYQTYLRNSQRTKSLRKREGIRYDGRLYDESMAEAEASFPNDSLAERKVKAGQIFQEKIRKYAEENFKLPPCSHNGMLQRSLLPKAGYGGMYTTEACQVRVNYQGGDYDPEGFGANDATSCPEFYDRDRAHEVIHQRGCQAAKKQGKTESHSIDELIEDEILAYRHSVKLSLAYVKLLSLQCSAKATPLQIQTRARRVQDLLSPYLKK